VQRLQICSQSVSFTVTVVYTGAHLCNVYLFKKTMGKFKKT